MYEPFTILLAVKINKIQCLCSYARSWTWLRQII